MGKIIVFSRTSTTQQDVEQQTKVLQLEATRLGYHADDQIVVEYQESATKLDIETRKGINKLKETIMSNNNVDTVICWELTRIARRADVIYNIRDFLLEYKIRWIILKPSFMELIDRNGQLTPTMSLMLGIFTSFAESEMMIKKERFIRAKSEMREHGQKFGGATIFGYIKNKEKKCVPHPTNGPIIVDIYNHYINTDSSLHETYLYISSKYPEIFPMMEYKKAQHKIRHFFEIDVYARGNWCYPPLVTEEMWNKVHEKMSQARCKARYNCKRDLLCRGKIYCGHCGRMMTGSGGNVKAYCCGTDKLHSLQINIDAADWIMWEETRCLVNINSSINHNNKIQEMNSLLDSKKVLKSQYDEVLGEIKQKMEKLIGLYMNNRIDEGIYNKKFDELKHEEKMYNDKKNKIDTEIESLTNILEETQKDIMHPQSINVDDIEDFETRQEFVRKYISKMIITKDEEEPEKKHIRFEFNVPVISTRSQYMYVAKNQFMKIYRDNGDGTVDYIHSINKTTKKNIVTGRFEKK